MLFKNVNEFAREVAKNEKGKKQVSIAQISEILKVINNLIPGFYNVVIDGIPEPPKAPETLSDNAKDIIKKQCSAWRQGRKNAQDGDEVVATIEKVLK